MRRTLFLLSLFIGFLTLTASAPSDTLSKYEILQQIQEDPAKAGGNHYNYPFGEYSVAKPPKDYEPVYISHYGRHGARYITDAAKYDHVAKLLGNGHDKGALTAEGESLYNDYMAIYPLLQYHNGDLTVKGQEQHRELARRMIKAYPSLFKKDAAIDARASVSPRAIVSMMSFCDEVRQLRPRVSIRYSADYSELDVTTLKAMDQDEDAYAQEFYSLFRNEYFGGSYAKAAAEIGLDADAFFLRFFKDMDAVKECGKPADLFGELAEIAYNIQCLDFEADLTRYFTPAERFQSWENANIYAVLMFLDNPYSRGLIAARAWQLADDMIELADSDLADGRIKVRLRFGHDTIVGPLLGFLGVPGWGPLGGDVSSWKYGFQSWNLPMASNVQMVFYRNKKNPSDMLVRVMYNEHDQILPLDDQSLAPYYKWSDFKARYLPEIERARAFCDGFRSGNPVLSIEGGRLQGVKEGDDVLVYKGVPFAAPPVGDLKGKPLQPVSPWDGVLVADKFPAAAMQAPFPKDDPLYYREFYTQGDPEYSEDCMYVNIWTPASAAGNTLAKLPVAVWIHGGALNHGYSFEKEMDGVEWAKRGVILVTIPYRLGEIGFGKDGHLGFQDQVSALRWVRDNIEAFGGDPSNVTVFGQSAGAISVKFLLSNPEAEPLFAKAIIQSGGGVNDMSAFPVLPKGTNGEDGFFVKAMDKGCFDSKPIMIGWVAQDPGFLGAESSLEFADMRAARPAEAPLYVYDFQRNPPGEKPGEIDFGAFHTAELWYTFGTLGRAWRPFTEADYELSRRMLDCWTSFARSGNPGWKAYDVREKYIEVFDIQ